MCWYRNYGKATEVQSERLGMTWGFLLPVPRLLFAPLGMTGFFEALGMAGVGELRWGFLLSKRLVHRV